MIIKFLNEEDIQEIHDYLLTISAGLNGTNLDKLNSVVHRIYHYQVYEGITDIFELAALYAIILSQGHPFMDGNKRTAFITMTVFLSINNYSLIVDPLEASDTMVDVATNKIKISQLKRWIKDNSIKNK